MSWRSIILTAAILFAAWADLAAAASPARLFVIDPAPLRPAEQTMLATLQGLANRTNAQVWLRAGGMSEILLQRLAHEGTALQTRTSVWQLVEEFRSAIAGAVIVDLRSDSLNAATSLAGLLNGVVADSTLTNELAAARLPVIADARGLTDADIFEKHRSEFARGIAVEQVRSKHYHLRDWAVAKRAFTYSTTNASEQTRYVKELGPLTEVFGWGLDERKFVEHVSQGGGAVIPADWSLNLSAMQHLAAAIPDRKLLELPDVRPDERIVCFVMTDGDNVQFMAGGFVTAPGFWANTNRGGFAMTWEMPPILARIAPPALAHYFETAMPNDDFVTGPSGFGYYFPNHVPDRAAHALKTAGMMKKSKLRIASVLNSGGSMADARELLDHPEIDAVFYKDYAPYNRPRGRVDWYSGKPAVGYRFVLWGNKPENFPAGVASAIASMPNHPKSPEDRFALINVHAWSFRELGGPMGAVAETIRRLPTGTRVVTATHFVELLKRANADK